MLKKGSRKCKYERVCLQQEYTRYTQNNKKIKQKMFDMWQLLAECEQQISNIFLIEITVVYDL